MQSVYLDFNATTPIHDEVARQMSGWLHAGAPANPSSLHRHGREARRDLEEARQRLASFLGVVPSELHFTSGGTESNNLAMFGLAPTDAPLHVGATEHPSILEPAKQQWLQGRPGGLLEVDSFGRIRDFEVVDGAFYSIQWVNNETGITQDIPDLARRIHAGGGLLHIDGAQGFFRFGETLPELGADSASITAHKSFGPIGVGALWVRNGLLVEPVNHGGPQEKKIRPGTENLLSIRGLGLLADIAQQSPLWDLGQLRESRAALISHLESIPDTRIVEHQSQDWPGCIHIGFLGIHAETLLVRLDMAGISASSGSACSSGAREPSHVLEAMGFEIDWIRGSVRLSMGPTSSVDLMTRVGVQLARIVAELRQRDLQSPPTA